MIADLEVMGRIADWIAGNDIVRLRDVEVESRDLAPGTRREGVGLLNVRSPSALPPVGEAAALRIADVYAACRVLADGVASLPLHVYRDTGAGRVPAGADQRLVALLKRPAPGSTAADLVSTAMVSLLLNGNAFIGKFVHEGVISQLAVLDAAAVTVELQGGRIVYRYSHPDAGLIELGASDVVHVKAMSADGLRGLSPVKQAMQALQLNQALATYLASWLGNDSRPGGVLTVTDGLNDLADTKRDAEELYGWEAAPAPGHGKIAVVTGDVTYTPVDPPLKDQEFVASREQSAREVARVMRVPAWAIDASTGDSLTYSNVQQQSRFLLDHCLRPWISRIEQAINADADLCPGGTYCAFDTDALTRMDPDARATFYKAGIEGGWLTVDEIRAREDLPPMPTSEVEQ